MATITGIEIGELPPEIGASPGERLIVTVDNTHYETVLVCNPMINECLAEKLEVLAYHLRRL